MNENPNDKGQDAPSFRHISTEDPDKGGSLKATIIIFVLLSGGGAIAHYVFHLF